MKWDKNGQKETQKAFRVFLFNFVTWYPWKGELLLYLVSHRKFYVWQNSSSGVIAENALRQSDANQIAWLLKV